ncbi:MAG: hypothetical protein JNJ55_03895 [Betaproteobacteria bacterium]|nr:hypothetical protein [Betaproteobacteria bacterium]
MNITRTLAIERIDDAFFERPGIDQYVVLSMLLHVFAIVALGDTRGGESRSGARGHGSILVSLVAPAPSERIDVRAAVRAPVSRLQTESSSPTQRTAQPAAGPVPEKTVAPTPIEVPAALQPVAAPQVETALAQPPTLPSTAFRAEPLAPVAVPQATTTFADVPAIPEPVRLPAPLAPIREATVNTEFARPVELKPAERPVLSTLQPIAPPVVKEIAQAAPSVSNVRVQAPAPLAPVEAPALKSFASPAQTKTLEAPSALSQPLAPLAPLPAARIEREFATPEFAKSSDVAVSVPPAIEKIAAPKVEKDFAPTREFVRAEPERAAEAAKPSPAAPVPQRETRAQAATAPAGESAIVSPRADTRLPTFGVSPPAPLPKTDLDGIKERARQIAREGTGPRTAIPFFTAPPPPKKEMEKAFDKALKRPECKDAYSEMGLAAVIPLIRDAVTEKGCKW